MSSTTMTIDQLRLSPLNVRTYGPDANDTEALQASILAEGRLINPISVHLMKGNTRAAGRTYGAIAGGRRYRAIKALIERAALPADWPVQVKVLEGLSDADLIEYSITENLLRRDLRDHELFAGVARAAARGHAPDEIARNLGQPDVAKVAKWLRMGQLAQPIFAAYAAGSITLDQARAFAATGDADLQLATFQRFARLDVHVPTPAEIRRAMAFGDEIARRELLFVGDELYRAAGGSFELDLFAEDAEERGRIADATLLRRLVDEKLALVRDEIRVTTQQRDLRFVVQPPQSEWNDADHQLSVSPKRLESGTLQLPEGDVVAHIKLSGGGEPVVTYWWASRKAKFGTEKPKLAAAAPSAALPTGNAIADPYGAKPVADAAVRDGDGLSKDAIFALTAVRKVMLRAALADDARRGGTTGADYLVWAQAKMLLVDRAPGSIGMRPIVGDNMVGTSHEGFALAREHVAATPASKVAAAAIAEVTRQDFFTAGDPVDGFLAFVSATPEVKALTAAVVAGVALERSLAAPGYKLPVHDVVAHQVGADRDEVLRGYWTPTGDMLDMFPKEQRRGLAEPFVDRASIATWAKLKSSELTAAVLRTLTRAGGAGATWVHPLLRFTSPLLAHQAIATERQREVA